MRVVVKLFGTVREAAGVKELSVSLAEGARIAELRELLAREHPVFEALGERLAASVNYEVVPFDTPLRDGDEVAFLPPVAGGAGSCWISFPALTSWLKTSRRVIWMRSGWTTARWSRPIPIW